MASVRDKIVGRVGKAWSALQRILAAADRWQGRHPIVAIGYGTLKKFGDDQANLLVVALGWFGFMSIYPLLLVIITSLGFIGIGSIGTGVVNTLKEFPVIGQNFNPGAGGNELHGSLPGLIIGVVGLVYGSQGVTQTAQVVLNRVWNIPHVDRPGFFPRLGRSFLGLVPIGLSFLVSAAASSLVTSTGRPYLVRIPVMVALLVVNMVCFIAAFRTLTPPMIPTRSLVLGAVTATIGFTTLTTVGTGLVQHEVRNMQATYGALAAVIGTVTYLLLLAEVTIYAAELNTVIARRLWPRSLPTVPPNAVDHQVWNDLVHEQRRREDQQVRVGFADRSTDTARMDARQADDHQLQPELDDRAGR